MEISLEMKLGINSITEYTEWTKFRQCECVYVRIRSVNQQMRVCA